MLLNGISLSLSCNCKTSGKVIRNWVKLLQYDLSISVLSEQKYNLELFLTNNWMHLHYVAATNACPQLSCQQHCCVNNESSMSKIHEKLHLETAWLIVLFLICTRHTSAKSYLFMVTESAEVCQMPQRVCKY